MRFKSPYTGHTNAAEAYTERLEFERTILNTPPKIINDIVLLETPKPNHCVVDVSYEIGVLDLYIIRSLSCADEANTHRRTRKNDRLRSEMRNIIPNFDKATNFNSIVF